MTHRLKSVIIVFAMFAVVHCFGCSQGAPRYVNDGRGAANTLRASKGLGGFDFFLENAADTDLEVQGVKGNRVTGEFEIQKLKVVSEQTKTNEVLLRWMTQGYTAMQAGFLPIRQADWAGWNQTWSTTMSGLSPIAQAYIQTGGLVGGLKAMRPSVVGELAMALVSGRYDQGELLGQLPPDLRAEVLRALIAPIQAARQPATPQPTTQPTSQPTEPP